MRAAGPGSANRAPEQPSHTPERVVALVRTAILVHHRALVPKRDYTGNRLPALFRDAYRHGVTKQCGKVVEPCQWLRRHSMAAARPHQQHIKFAQQFRRKSSRNCELLPFRPANLALERTLMRVLEQLLERQA